MLIVVNGCLITPALSGERALCSAELLWCLCQKSVEAFLSFCYFALCPAYLVLCLFLYRYTSLWLYNNLCGYISLKITIWILSPYSFSPKNYFSYFSSSTFPCKFWNNLVYSYKTLCWNFGSNSIKLGKVLTYLLCWVIQSMNTVCFCVFCFEHTNYTCALLKLHLNISFLLGCEFYF